MSRSTRTYLPMMTLLLASLACVVPGLTGPDADAISTAAAETIIVELTRNGPQVTVFPVLDASSTATFTAEPPTFTPTETVTPTETFTPLPIFTPTSAIPLITVSVSTNCRNGPGKVYVYVGALLVGQTAEVYGRDPTSQYWYIRNPDLSPEFCWVWGKYATLVGPSSFLPILTPPPTPTPTLTPTPSPSFTVKYSSLDTCNSSWWVEVQLKNTGPIVFKSLEISVFDTVTDVEAIDLADGFVNRNACLQTTTKDVLNPGETYPLSGPVFTYDPSGHKLRVTITLCSNTGQKGMCITNKIDFKP